jgi:putative peptidoglycan lipid II flippase
LGRYLVSALFQTGEFGDGDTLYVWYILLGSTAGLLAATWGRLYSSTFYALRDTRTPLRFAVIRVALTATLGVLFAFPLRPLVETLLYGVLGLKPAPGGEIALGAVGLTLASGTAGWVEFALLKRALARKIGPVTAGLGYHARLWTAALAAGTVSIFAVAWGGSTVIRLVGFAPYVVRAAWALGWFGVVYIGLTLATGVPEVRRLMRRK